MILVDENMSQDSNIVHERWTKDGQGCEKANVYWVSVRLKIRVSPVRSRPWPPLKCKKEALFRGFFIFFETGILDDSLKMRIKCGISWLVTAT